MAVTSALALVLLFIVLVTDDAEVRRRWLRLGLRLGLLPPPPVPQAEAMAWAVAVLLLPAAALFPALLPPALPTEEALKRTAAAYETLAPASAPPLPDGWLDESPLSLPALPCVLAPPEAAAGLALPALLCASASCFACISSSANSSSSRGVNTSGFPNRLFIVVRAAAAAAATAAAAARRGRKEAAARPMFGVGQTRKMPPNQGKSRLEKSQRYGQGTDWQLRGTHRHVLACFVPFFPARPRRCNRWREHNKRAELFHHLFVWHRRLDSID